MKKSKGNGQVGWQVKCKSLTLVRYADDFVIIHEDETVVQRCQLIIAEWLKGMGLELIPSKTRLTHTLHKYDGQEPGFDFLGFNIRQYPVGKYQSGKNNGILLGFKTLIKPSSKKVEIHTDALNSIIKAHKAAPQEALINRLNPVITGWANYYSSQVSKEIYSKVNSIIYQQLRAWGNHRHPNKNAHWITNRYWLVNQGEGWVFATKEKGKGKMRLKKHSDTPIVRRGKNLLKSASP